ncbi:2'-5' RNA ligase family protein [Dyadobacter chenhuakuii]|uniref:2'-5' RNA ligase family protein n=1 Tax=Dyadobacter chenhuakuii TaxID=2909339 RepID=A0A9X1QDQ5_9BACT|nr:2'-5' RNA ligase family protein [Dyadobacter chenhuakuii]MCF2497929.1 2'-5' RNA ligase family protein [Dyadobacter chenhuakuii]
MENKEVLQAANAAVISMNPPLVATLSIDPAAQAYFDDLRMRHFPKERNHLNAHLTLFNALPDEAWIFEKMQMLTGSQVAFEVKADQVMSLGGGTAFKIVSPELALLHRNLQTHYQEVLTNQDKQKRNFHITVQNKVEPAVAKSLQAELRATFEPFIFAAEGVHLWRYLGGQWKFLRTYRFNG